MSAWRPLEIPLVNAVEVRLPRFLPDLAGGFEIGLGWSFSLVFSDGEETFGPVRLGR